MAATRTSQSRWRRHADQVIADVLREMPAGATLDERRAACDRAYPFGERHYLPYKHWLAAMRAQFGEARPRKRKMKELPRPKPTGNQTVDGLLAALRESPLDTTTRLMLADAVEEFLRMSGERIRKAQPKADDVMQRLWPGSKTVYRGTAAEMRSEVHSSHGGFIMLVRDLCDMIEGRTLLVDPEIARAAEIERTAAVLRMFGG